MIDPVLQHPNDGSEVRNNMTRGLAHALARGAAHEHLDGITDSELQARFDTLNTELDHAYHLVAMAERAATIGDIDISLDKHGTLVFQHNPLPAQPADDPRFDTGHTGGSEDEWPQVSTPGGRKGSRNHDNDSQTRRRR